MWLSFIFHQAFTAILSHSWWRWWWWW